MKRLAICITVVAAGFIAACGGGNSNPAPPPPSGNFSNASLSGQYAFSMNGVESVTGAYVARVGSFSADGAGHITGGLEDVLSLSAAQPPALVSFSGGTYQIQQNGRGVMALNASTGGGLLLSFSMQSTSQGFVIQTDGAASTSGTFVLQTPNDFAGNAVVGKYVFDVSGISFAGANPAPVSIIGQFAADGNGNITGGTLDDNDGSFTPSGPVAIPASTYQLDNTGNGANFGRGTMTINGRTFAFYIVNGQRLKLLEEDLLGGSEGDAVLQTGLIPTQNSGFTGSFVLLTGGAATTGDFGPDTRAGRYTADGSGNIGTVIFDDNNDGNYTHISSGVSNATYNIDTTNAGTGRGTVTFKTSSLGILSYVFYLYSPTQAVIQDVSSGVVGDGTMRAQAQGPIALNNVQGTYVFNWSGVQLVNPSPFEEDFVGQYKQSTTANTNITGVSDYTQLGLSSNNGVTLNAGISGTLTLSGDGTQTNGYKIAVGGSSPFTINFVAYYADTGTVLVLCSDSNRTTAGLATQQTQ